jgi:hypothetical protein
MRPPATEEGEVSPEPLFRRPEPERELGPEAGVIDPTDGEDLLSRFGALHGHAAEFRGGGADLAEGQDLATGVVD